MQLHYTTTGQLRSCHVLAVPVSATALSSWLLLAVISCLWRCHTHCLSDH